MLGLPGLQGRLLGEFEGLDRPGRAAVPDLELPGEFTAPDVDHQPAGGPGLKEPLIDADDLPDRSFALLAGALGELHTQRVAQQSFQAGVVPLGGGDGELVQRPAVQRQPAAASAPAAAVSATCTLLLTATWVCRFGSPARLSRWVNAAAINPRVSTWRTAPRPSRV